MSRNSPVITKSVRLASEESEGLKHISKTEGTSEAALIRRFIREGMAQYRLEEAIEFYARGEVDVSAAAHHAGVSVYQMMTELQWRDITPPAAREKFLDGLETLAETFGGSEALFRTIAQMRQSEEDETVAIN
ncbi:MAG: hypothetical protein MAG451_02971 [Anaerolineales bacterium]|nr:hypothetical protein [Anaerolineales bacterium]